MKRIAIILVPVVAAVLVVVWTSNSVNHEGYRIAALHRQRQALLRTIKDLEIEVSRLQALDRIERAARELGLMVPRENQIILVQTAAGAVQTAAGAVQTAAGGVRQAPQQQH